jgi:hypothetical protein
MSSARQQGKSRIVAMAAAEFGKHKRVTVFSADPERMKRMVLKEAGGAWPIKLKVKRP